MEQTITSEIQTMTLQMTQRVKEIVDNRKDKTQELALKYWQ